MSADNGIYIARFPEGYRVAHAQSIDNCFYYPEGSVQRRNTLRDYFGDSEVFVTAYNAWLYAKELSKQYPTLEYGVSYIGEFESFLDPFSVSINQIEKGHNSFLRMTHTNGKYFEWYMDGEEIKFRHTFESLNDPDFLTASSTLAKELTRIFKESQNANR